MSSETDFVSFYSNQSQKQVKIELKPLPLSSEVIKTLAEERAQLKHWISCAKHFYSSGLKEDYCEILERARDAANLNYNDCDKDQMSMLDGLAAYYVGLARRESNRETKREHLIRATRLYTAADKVIMLHEDHLIGRAFLCLLEPDKLDQADAQFNFVLDQNPNNILAMVGKARINYLRNEPKVALNYYRKTLERFSLPLPFIRVAIGICLHRLGKVSLAGVAFERAVELDSSCAAGLAALAILKINDKSPESIKQGMQYLTRAYSFDQRNPLVLNVLADHFFYKADYDKVERLATQALAITNNDNVRAFSYYLLAKCFHIKDHRENAFNYYFQSSRLASSKFVLPLYGLGQIYIMRGEFKNAIDCFEKVLRVHDQNTEAIKLLAFCYMKSNDTVMINKAKDLYKKLTTLFINDEESWLGLAQSQCQDPKESLASYLRVLELKTAREAYISPEIYNNMGSLYFRLNNFVEARKNFEMAIKLVEQSSVLSDSTIKPITATLRYNLGRVIEKFGCINEAETIYQEILKDFPDYIDCYLRLGDIMKHRGDFRGASEWFNMALKIDPDNNEAWLHIANLHVMKQEFGPAQKKFEKVRTSNQDNPDSYAWLSLGNIWLSLLHTSGNDAVKQRKFSERCLGIYKSVLKRNPNNICAANGIGCVLAYNNQISMARDVFSQCREATADIMDIWINLGNIYMESKQYANAIKMYESCYDKFCSNKPDSEVLIYLARAYFKAQQLKKSKITLLKILFYSPRHLLALFNLSLILQKTAEIVLEKEKLSLSEVETTIAELELAKRNFGLVAADPEHSRIDPAACECETIACSDLLVQASYQLKKAKQYEEQEAEMIRIHKVKLEEIAKLKAEEEQRQIEDQRLKEEELIQKRSEYLKNVQASLTVLPLDERQKKKTIKNINEEDDQIRPSKRKKTNEENVKPPKKEQPQTIVDDYVDDEFSDDDGLF